MNLVQKALFLKTVSLFEDLELDLILPIADKLDPVVVKKAKLIYHPNEVANRMYFIQSGKIELLSDNKKAITKLKTPSFFGYDALFADERRQHFALCKETSTLFALSKSHLYTLLTQLPKVAISLLKIYAKERFA